MVNPMSPRVHIRCPLLRFCAWGRLLSESVRKLPPISVGLSWDGCKNKVLRRTRVRYALSAVGLRQHRVQVRMARTSEHPVISGHRNGHDNCLVCGGGNPWSLGLRFRVSDGGTVRAQFEAHPGLQGYDGILHGGVISGLLDAAMTHCLFHHGVRAVTADLHVRFLHPVSCEALLEVKAWLLAARPPLYRVAAELVHKRQVMASAEAKFMPWPDSS